MIYIGIDPGLSGGIAWYSSHSGIRAAYKMPVTDRELLDAVEGLLTLSGELIALLERVHASPQMGVTSAFTFGRGYGKLEMALTAARIPFDYVQPAKWQRAMGCLTKGDKNVSKARAQQLFPELKITHAIADALLIAEYGRRLHTGTLA